MPTATVKGGANAFGYDVNWRTDITSDAGQVLTPELNLAVDTATWVKTGYTTGTGTLTTGHGQTTGTFDLYWTESGVNKRRYGTTLTVSTDAISVTGGSGDNTPANDTIVTICKQTDVDLTLTGDDLTFLCISGTSRCIFCMTDSLAAVTKFEVNATLGELWHNESVLTNPIDGLSIVSATASSANKTAPVSPELNEPLTVLIQNDGTP